MMSRLALLGFCCLVGLCLLALPQPSSPAQAKKKGTEELAKARQRLEQLERQLKEKELRIDQLQADLKRTKGDDKQDNQTIQQLRKQLKEKDQQLEQQQADLKKKGAGDDKELDKLRQQVKDLEGVKKAVLVHARIYRLKEGGSEEQAKALVDDVTKTLAKVPGVRGLWVGRPAAPGTPELAPTNYQVGVVVLLDGADALATFLDNPQHQKLAARLQKNWEKPTVYDFQRERE